MYEEKVKILVRKGELGKAIEFLFEWSKEQNSSIQKRVNLTAARFQRLERSKLSGVISDNDYNLELNKITASILDLIGPKQNIVLANEAKISKKKVLVSVVSISALLVIIWVTMKFYSHPNPLQTQIKNRITNLSINISRTAENINSDEFSSAFNQLNNFREDSLHLLEDEALFDLFSDFYIEVNKYKRKNRDINLLDIKTRANEILKTCE